jgi:hypothetical protein
LLETGKISPDKSGKIKPALTPKKDEKDTIHMIPEAVLPVNAIFHSVPIISIIALELVIGKVIP